MKDFKAIHQEFARIDHASRQSALATVVKVRGSSYRSPGARMLITDDGRWVGSISGGCLEGDALRKARKVMSDRKPMVVTYDTREESNQNLGIGLGCNGVIDVLIEPIQESDPNNPISVIDSFISSDEPILMATIINGGGTGERLVLKNEDILFQSMQENFPGLKEDLVNLLRQGRSYVKNYEDAELFLEIIQPSISLILFGGGFDARPVSNLAKSLGWNVTVTDECVAHIAPIFFPTADTLSLCQRQFIDRDFKITRYTACMLMSHNYEYDRDVLRKLLGTSTPYIGILGPRKRFDKMQEELRKEGISLSPDDHHRIHSPVGVDIGAEAPDEIALSIIAEIQAKFTNRSGGFLKYKAGPIHERTSDDQVFKQVYFPSVDIQQMKSI